MTWEGLPRGANADANSNARPTGRNITTIPVFERKSEGAVVSYTTKDIPSNSSAIAPTTRHTETSGQSMLEEDSTPSSSDCVEHFDPGTSVMTNLVNNSGRQLYKKMRTTDDVEDLCQLATALALLARTRIELLKVESEIEA